MIMNASGSFTTIVMARLDRAIQVSLCFPGFPETASMDPPDKPGGDGKMAAEG
jgi:hypothetical protein